MPDIVYIVFLFALGACIGSFLNVVVWRLPRGESLSTPPSHCPKCDQLLLWRDNLPIVGWIKLGGKCRFCKAPISARYPIVEAVTALLFVFYYVMFYRLRLGPCSPAQLAGAAADDRAMSPVPPMLDWPMLLLYLFTVSALLAASLIDAELFVIPAGIPWLMAGVGLLAHALLDHPSNAGALNVLTSPAGPSPTGALAAGGSVGLLISLALWYRGILPTSFPEGEPLLEVDRDAVAEEIREAKRAGTEPPALPPPYTPRQIRGEMRKEMLFLFPPMALGVLWLVLTARLPALRAAWGAALSHDWVTGLLGSLFGGLVGGFVVWVTRILGTLGFGRVAMGLGDVDLMFGVGAVLGAGAATVAFFVAPFFGILIALYMLVTGTRRELPYGPYLSLATAFIMLFYCPIAAYLAPGVSMLVYYLTGLAGA